MDRLVSHGLRFGNLLRIDQPNLIERYRRAMACLGHTPTKLDVIHVDASGFSPEVADELSNQRYLDPHGVNRHLIILTPEQRKLPLLNVTFSADVALVRRFFIDNDRAIRTLTLRDAVYGEIENLTFEVETLKDVLSLREVTFELHTPSGILEDAQKLGLRAERFLTEPDAWKSGATLDAIVEGAKRCGDVRTNGIVPAHLSYQWPDVFRTSHFGGLYVLRDDARTVVVGKPEMRGPAEEAGVGFVDLGDPDGTFNVLREEACMEPFNPAWLESSGVLDQRLHLLVVEIMAKVDADFDPMRVIEDPFSNKWIHAHLDNLRTHERFRAISTMRQIVGNGGDAAAFEQSLPARHRMMFRRALPEHLGAWDINRLLLRWARFDTLSLYALDKPGFYDFYAGMDPRMREFTVQYILRHYQSGDADVWRKKAEFRERIFGIHQI